MAKVELSITLDMKEIRRIIEVYDNTNHATEKVALASVVKVEESSYRRIGARMLVKSTGIWVGGISGGCLEGDALKHSQMAIFKNTPSKVVYDTMDDDKNQIGVGLGCNGRIEVLFTPIDPNDPNNEIEILRKVVDLDKPSILLKVIDAKQKQLLGSNLLIEQEFEELDFHGINTMQLQDLVRETKQNRKPRIMDFLTESGDALSILVEFIKPETRLVIVGDNYDVNAFMGIAKELGWEVHIVCRMKKLSKTAFKLAKRVVEYEQADSVPIHDYTAVVLMSHDYNWDKTLLPIFLAEKPPYIGMLGPKKRREKMQGEPEFQDINLAELVNLHSPVGLDIGAESPEEIALSIAAEIVASFRNRSGAPLKYRDGTIHEREAMVV